MTDRINAFTVVLAEDLRDDDPELAKITDAISMIKGVIDIQPRVAEFADQIALARARSQMGGDILNAVYTIIHP